jgi:hypothetical protein
MPSPQRSLAGSFLLTFIISLLCLSPTSSSALPAFARKYGLRCSACHETWPMLNFFGQKFKDNGYQLMNDRDSPIWQNNAYWPATLRMTPNWHRESTNKVSVDQSPTGLRRIESSGFDLSGLDFHTGGMLEKNISFYLLPSSDPTGAFHFEPVFGRNISVYSLRTAGIGRACPPSTSFFSELCALLHSGGFRGRSNDSGIAQRDSDLNNPTYARIHWHDFYRASQAKSGSTDGVRRRNHPRLVKWRPQS